MKYHFLLAAGVPSPSVIWLKNGAVLDQEFEKLKNSTVRLVFNTTIYHRGDEGFPQH